MCGLDQSVFFFAFQFSNLIGYDDSVADDDDVDDESRSNRLL